VLTFYYHYGKISFYRASAAHDKATKMHGKEFVVHFSPLRMTKAVQQQFAWQKPFVVHFLLARMVTPLPPHDKHFPIALKTRCAPNRRTSNIKERFFFKKHRPDRIPGSSTMPPPPAPLPSPATERRKTAGAVVVAMLPLLPCRPSGMPQPHLGGLPHAFTHPVAATWKPSQCRCTSGRSTTYGKKGDARERRERR
jgi:hypothetical protein